MSALLSLPARLIPLARRLRRGASRNDAATTESGTLRRYFFETANSRMPTVFSAISKGRDDGDAQLVERIVSAYRASQRRDVPGVRSRMWDDVLSAMKREVHNALMGDMAKVRSILRDPGTTNLLHGFDIPSRSLVIDQPHAAALVLAIYQALLTMLEAIGTRRLWNWEAPSMLAPLPDVEHLLTLLDSALGFPISFPNPFAGEVGIATSRGVIGPRAVQALYQAHRISCLLDSTENPRIAEIGGGTGRTAFYASQLGLIDYAIVDLPMTAVAQGYFLGRTMGAEKVCLSGEQRAGVRLLHPAEFLADTSRYDLVINVDSLTEMSRQTALAYCIAIKSRCDLFLSINHEVNTFTAREVCAAAGMRQLSRTPCWVRRGYVEETFKG